MTLSARRHVRLGLTLGLCLIALGVAGTARAGEHLEIDPVHSHVGFRIRHLGAGYVYGRFNRFRGQITHGEKGPAGGSVTVEVDPASIDTRVPKRDNHLRSPDFFDVKQFPMMRFRSQSVTALGKDRFRVRGTLLLHGVEREIEVEARLLGRGKGMEGETRVGYLAEFTLRRSEFGMKYMLGPIGDEVDVVIAIEAIVR